MGVMSVRVQDVHTLRTVQWSKQMHCASGSLAWRPRYCWGKPGPGGDGLPRPQQRPQPQRRQQARWQRPAQAKFQPKLWRQLGLLEPSPSAALLEGWQSRRRWPSCAWNLQKHASGCWGCVQKHPDCFVISRKLKIELCGAPQQQ